MQSRRTVLPLTPLEFDIMKALWEQDSASVHDVQEYPSVKRRGLAYNTVQTMLNILVDKGKASRRKKGRAFIYQPLMEKESFLKNALGEVVDRLFDGDAESLVMNLLETRRLTPDRLERLKTLLEEEEL